MKKICFIIPSLEIGGAEKVVSLLANNMVDKNFEITLICLFTKVDFPLDKRVNLLVPAFKVSRSIKSFLKTLRYYRRSIKRLKPDLIFSFLEFYNEIVMLSTLGLKQKTYLFDRNSPYMKPQNTVHAILRKLLYPMATGVVVQTSKALKLLQKEKLNKNILVLPNPISEINFEWQPNNDKIITVVGSLEEQKNHKYLIDIFFEVGNPDWVLQIVGEGSLRKALEDYINDLGMKDRIKLLGKRTDTYEILSKTTIFAFSSLWEGFPNALLEAVVMGVPSISNNCDTGPEEIIQDGISGFLVSPGDKEKYRKKLLFLMSDEQKRLDFSQQGKLSKKKYLLENISKKLLDFCGIDL